MRGQRVLITGGAGFLGRAILRKSIREGWGSRFTIVSRDETKQDELVRKYGKDVDVRPFLGDVTGGVESLATLMRGHDVVIHAAAVKYIPEAERNRWECTRINVHGSEVVAAAAKIAGVSVVCGISTDKAVEPVNTYGLTKALMESLYQEANRWGGPNFVTVRYGNVVGSTGSVIPRFMGQVVQDRHITITDPRMSRFWLSPDAAVELVEFAVDAALQGDLWTGQPRWAGTTLVDACPSMTIGQLALACIEAAEVDPRTVTIEEIGIRPGEKLAEALLGAAEAATRAVRWTYPPQDRGFIVLPPEDPRLAETEKVGEPYYSDDPREWVTVPKMVEWIKDAAAI